VADQLHEELVNGELGCPTCRKQHGVIPIENLSKQFGMVGVPVFATHTNLFLILFVPVPFGLKKHHKYIFFSSSIDIPSPTGAFSETLTSFGILGNEPHHHRHCLRGGDIAIKLL